MALANEPLDGFVLSSGDEQSAGEVVVADDPIKHAWPVLANRFDMIRNSRAPSGCQPKCNRLLVMSNSKPESGLGFADRIPLLDGIAWPDWAVSCQSTRDKQSPVAKCGDFTVFIMLNHLTIGPAGDSQTVRSNHYPFLRIVHDYDGAGFKLRKCRTSSKSQEEDTEPYTLRVRNTESSFAHGAVIEGVRVFVAGQATLEVHGVAR
jgi:hypothetical protein